MKCLRDRDDCELGKMTIKEIVINPPDTEVIEYLEYLVKRAKLGEIQSIAVIGSRGNYTTFNGFVGMEKNNRAIIGEIEIMKTDLIHCFFDLRSDIL